MIHFSKTMLNKIFGKFKKYSFENRFVFHLPGYVH